MRDLSAVWSFTWNEKVKDSRLESGPIPSEGVPHRLGPIPSSSPLAVGALNKRLDVFSASLILYPAVSWLLFDKRIF